MTRISLIAAACLVVGGARAEELCPAPIWAPDRIGNWQAFASCQSGLPQRSDKPWKGIDMDAENEGPHYGNSDLGQRRIAEIKAKIAQIDADLKRRIAPLQAEIDAIDAILRGEKPKP